MSDARDMLVQTAERLFADLAARRDADPAEVWAEIEAVGLPLVLAPEAAGGFGLNTHLVGAPAFVRSSA